MKSLVGVLLLCTIASYVWATGSITVTGYPPVPRTIKGGDGIEITPSGIINATGVPAGGVSENTFKNYTSIDRLTKTEVVSTYQTKVGFSNRSTAQANTDAAQNTEIAGKLSASGTAYDTARVNGTTAATVASGAALGATALQPTGSGAGLTGVLKPGDVRGKLTADRTYYVATTGNDSNNGLAVGTPFKTLKHAVEVIARTLDLGQYNAIVQLADGTYTDTPGYRADISIPQMVTNAGWELDSSGAGPTGQIVIQGNATTPGNVTFVCSSGHHCIVGQGARFTLKNFRLQALGVTGDLVNVQGRTTAILTNMIYGTMGTGTDVNSNPGPPEGNGGHHIYVEDHGTVVTEGTQTIEAGCGGHVVVTNNSNAYLLSTDTLIGTPAFSRAFAEASANSFIIPNTTYSGAATGVRYILSGNSAVIGAPSSTYFPGNTAGTVSTGGFYGTSETYLAASKVGTVTNTKWCTGDSSSNIQCTSDAPSGGSMTYPTGTGIAVVSSGTSWGTTLAAPTGAIVGTTDTQTLSGKTLTAPVVAVLKPASDSTTAVQITKADGTTPLINVDSTNSKVGFGTVSPAYGITLLSTTSPYITAQGSTLGGGMFVSRNYTSLADPAVNDLFGALYFGADGATSGHGGTIASVFGNIDSAFVGGDARGRGRLVFNTSDGTASLKERMRINSTGEVGIGKTAASGVELDVSGDISASGTVTATGGFSGNITGNVTGNVTGNATGTAGGLSGTPNISVGTITASGDIATGKSLARFTTGATVKIGEVLEQDPSTNWDTVKSGVNSTAWVGISLGTGGAGNSLAMNGTTAVMLKDTTACTRGQYVSTSDTAGRAVCSSSAPSTVAGLLQFIGIATTSVSSGTDITVGVQIRR